jgi:23S rRNA (adenine-C8)-methyltransferase
VFGWPRSTRYATLQQVLAELGVPSYRLTQVLGAVHQHGVVDFEQMTQLPRSLRDQLAERLGPSWIRLSPLAIQRGDQVEKVLFTNTQGARVETVFARFRGLGSAPGKQSERGWTSLCLSTQVGCGLGCTFCATGAVGLVRNLTADEICEQVLHFSRQENIDSVAFMGMGEALANPHTFGALEILSHARAFALAPRRITVSTVGFLPVTLTLSVHSPFDAERATLIPLQRRFPLNSCLDVLDSHVARTRRKTYLAYLLLAGVNDSDDHAWALAELVRARSRPELFHVSVIPYNEAAGVSAAYRRPPEGRTQRFVRLLQAGGVRATRRQQFGGELDAACGQLHARYLEGGGAAMT